MTVLSVARPLVVSSDDAIVDDLVRLAAAAGTDVTVVSDAALAVAQWPKASMVLVGADEAAAMSLCVVTRRTGVVVVTRDTEATDVWKDAVAIGAEHVVALPTGEQWLVERLAQLREGPNRDGRVIAVSGVCGGAGASTFAVALACTAARRGQRTLLIDGDRTGGGLDIAIGIEDAVGARWPELVDVEGRLSLDSLAHALPKAFDVSVLSWDRRHSAPATLEAIDSVMDAAIRGFDTVIVDAGRSGQLYDWVLSHGIPIAMVIPSRLRAVGAAMAVLDGDAGSNAVVVARATSSLSVNDVAEALGRPVVAVIKDDDTIAKRCENGDPAGNHERDDLAHAATVILDAA